MTEHRKLTEEGNPNKSGSFSISKEILANFFERHDIDSQATVTKIKSYGGVSGLVKKLKTDIKKGLDSNDQADLIKRGEFYDTNIPVVAEQKTLWDLIKEPFEDVMLKVISISGIVNLAIGFAQGHWETGWIDGVSILFAVVLIVCVTAGNNYMQQKQFEKLYKEAEIFTVQVIRNSETKFIKNTEILVGDILRLTIGDILPVDGILVQGNEIVVDESNITGEPKEIHKFPPTEYEIEVNHNTPYLISGAKIMDGEGCMLVCTVGNNSQLGKMKMKLQEESPPTPLQLKLEGLSNVIAKIAIVASLLTVLALLGNLIYSITADDKCFICFDTLDALLNAFVIGVTVIVVAVPEGLPLAVTLALAYSVNKMRQENNWVRFLKACETMGGVNNICTDKTGTLTTNCMTAESLYFEGKILENEALAKKNNYTATALQLLCESICINSSIQRKTLPNGKNELVGSKTEVALTNFSDALDYKFENIKNQDNIVKVNPFSSKRKKMLTIYKVNANKFRVFTKGASEVILGLSTSIIGKNGNIEPLSKDKKSDIMNNVIGKFAAEALRTISIAYKEINVQNPSTNPLNMTDQELEKDLILIAVVGIRDPLRKEIPSAIAKCKSAGITVRMVTGDNSQTAVSIARNCGILEKDFNLEESTQKKEHYVLEGAQFTKLIGGLIDVKIQDLDMFKVIIKELRVMSRSTPEDKYALVTGLMELDNVVAVTGDGTNDAPALKKAHIGFAMDSGTAIAKEAAGIILLDDNFNSIVLACKWGRNIFESIRKFVQFQMTINIVALVLTFVGSVVLSSSPLTAVQMLWINLIMDTFAALALATEPPTEELLNRRPYSIKEDIITPGMKRFISGHAIYQLIVLFIILFLGPEIFDIANTADFPKYDKDGYVHFTIFFQTFVLMQIFNSINSRKLNKKDINVFANFMNNPLFFVIMGSVSIVQFFFVEFGGEFVKCSPLTITQHLICIVLGAFGLIIGLVIKMIPETWFDKIHFFKENVVDVKNMDGTLASKLKRKATSRLSYKGH